MPGSRTLNAFSRVVNDLAIILLQEDILSIRKIEIKNDLSPLSDVDIKIQDIVELLIRKYLPSASLISEESFTKIDLSKSTTCVVLDPIDGTENFISGIPIWGTGIALFHESKLVAGCTLFPELGLIAKTKNIAFVENNSYRHFRKHANNPRIRLFSSNSHWKEQINKFGDENRIFGCSLFNLSHAALGNGTYYSSDAGVRLWDIAPALAMALENELEVIVNGIEFKGQFLDPNSRFMVQIKIP